MPEIDLGSVVGPQGPQGVPGPAGAQGIQGEPGEAGKSAYQAARDGGYTGTEAEFNAIMAIINAHAGRHKTGGADPLAAADVGALGLIGSISAETSVDSYTKMGTYYCYGDDYKTVDNRPFDTAFFMSVFTAQSSRILQLATPTSTNIAVDMAYRIGISADNNVLWTAWKKIGTTNIVYDLTTTGNLIPENGDLDNYTTPGEIYRSPNAETSATISNTPFTSGGFKLVVERGYNANIVTQNLYSGGNSSRWYRNYYGSSNGWSRWFGVATTEYALPRDGSQPMTGVLKLGNYVRVSGDVNGLKVVSGVNTDTTILSRQLVVSSPNYSPDLATALKLYDVDSAGKLSNYSVLHTGNKPSGSYTGNNSVRSELIGGVGRAVLIQSGNGIGFVTAYGAVFIGSDGVSKYFDNTVIRYGHTNSNGLLEILGDAKNPLFNYSQVAYTYQVL